MPTRPIEEVPDLLEAIHEDLLPIPAALKAERRARRWQVVLLAALILAVFALGYRVEQNRKASALEARCSIRTAFIAAGVRLGAEPEVLDPVIADLDSNLGTGNCSPVSICRDGTPSQSSGPGTCSRHGGVDRLTPTPTTQGD